MLMNTRDNTYLFNGLISTSREEAGEIMLWEAHLGCPVKLIGLDDIRNISMDNEHISANESLKRGSWVIRDMDTAIIPRTLYINNLAEIEEVRETCDFDIITINTFLDSDASFPRRGVHVSLASEREGAPDIMNALLHNLNSRGEQAEIFIESSWCGGPDLEALIRWTRALDLGGEYGPGWKLCKINIYVMELDRTYSDPGGWPGADPVDINVTADEACGVPALTSGGTPLDIMSIQGICDESMALDQAVRRWRDLNPHRFGRLTIYRGNSNAELGSWLSPLIF